MRELLPDPGNKLARPEHHPTKVSGLIVPDINSHKPVTPLLHSISQDGQIFGVYQSVVGEVIPGSGSDTTVRQRLTRCLLPVFLKLKPSRWYRLKTAGSGGAGNLSTP
jgi:hypothetical protein